MIRPLPPPTETPEWARLSPRVRIVRMQTARGLSGSWIDPDHVFTFIEAGEADFILERKRGHLAARGFGGSVMNETRHFADRIVTVYKPRAIVFYEGDNDLAEKLPPEQVFAAFKGFVEIVHRRLPEVRIYLLPRYPPRRALHHAFL